MSQRTPTEHEIDVMAADFVIYGDQSKAFRLAFPDSEAMPETQTEQASKVFAMHNIRTRIDELRALSKNNSEEEFELSVSDLKTYLKTIIEKGIADGESTDSDGNKTIKVGNLSAAVSAIKEVNAMDGNHSPLKTQEIKANELTPWDDIDASTDKNDKEE